MKKLLLLLAITTTAHAGQWGYSNPSMGGTYPKYNSAPGAGYQPYDHSPGVRYTPYNSNPSPSTYDVIRSEQYYDLHIRPHLDPRRR